MGGKDDVGGVERAETARHARQTTPTGASSTEKEISLSVRLGCVILHSKYMGWFL